MNPTLENNEQLKYVDFERLPNVAPEPNHDLLSILEEKPQTKRLLKQRAKHKSGVDPDYSFLNPHETVVTSLEIDVDAKIADLVETLWKLGFETMYSCEGYAELFDLNGILNNDQHAAHIVFPNMGLAALFAERSYGHLVYAYPNFVWDTLMSMHPMLPIGGYGVRAMVCFNPLAIEPLTRYCQSRLV